MRLAVRLRPPRPAGHGRRSIAAPTAVRAFRPRSAACRSYLAAVLLASALLTLPSCAGSERQVVTVDGVKVTVWNNDGLLCLKEEGMFAADGRQESGGGGGCGDGPTKDNPVIWGVHSATRGGAIGTAGAGVAVTSGLVLGAALPNVEQFDLTIGDPDPELTTGSETRPIRPTRGKKADSVSVWRTTVETANFTVLQKISVSNIRYSGPG